MNDSFAVDPSVQEASSPSDLPVDSAWLFPEYDAGQMDPLQYRGVIIERVLERGSEEQLQWLFRTYGEPLVADWMRKHGLRLLSKRSSALWRLALDVVEFDTPDWAIAAKAYSHGDVGCYSENGTRICADERGYRGSSLHEKGRTGFPCPPFVHEPLNGYRLMTGR